MEENLQLEFFEVAKLMSCLRATCGSVSEARIAIGVLNGYIGYGRDPKNGKEEWLNAVHRALKNDWRDISVVLELTIPEAFRNDVKQLIYRKPTA